MISEPLILNQVEDKIGSQKMEGALRSLVVNMFLVNFIGSGLGVPSSRVPRSLQGRVSVPKTCYDVGPELDEEPVNCCFFDDETGGDHCRSEKSQILQNPSCCKYASTGGYCCEPGCEAPPECVIPYRCYKEEDDPAQFYTCCSQTKPGQEICIRGHNEYINSPYCCYEAADKICCGDQCPPYPTCTRVPPVTPRPLPEPCCFCYNDDGVRDWCCGEDECPVISSRYLNPWFMPRRLRRRRRHVHTF